MKERIIWQHCDLCNDILPHKIYVGMVVDFSECLVCGDHKVEKRKEVA